MKVQSFTGINIDIYSLVPLLGKNPYLGTNELVNYETSETVQNLLKLKDFVLTKLQVSHCYFKRH